MPANTLVGPLSTREAESKDRDRRCEVDLPITACHTVNTIGKEDAGDAIRMEPIGADTFKMRSVMSAVRCVVDSTS